MSVERERDEGALWRAWSRGEGRCPYCIGQEWEDFLTICDCDQIERECPRV